MNVARYKLTAPCYLKQAGQTAPAFVDASRQHPAEVILPAGTKESAHLKLLAPGEAPKGETLKPPYAKLAGAGAAQSAADRFSKPKPKAEAPKAEAPKAEAPKGEESKPAAEGDDKPKRQRAADRD